MAVCEYDPFSYRIHEDPYPTYRRLQAEAPLYHNDALGFWALSRHADVFAAVGDPARFSNRNGDTLEPGASGPDAHRLVSFLAMDPPEHPRLRALVSRTFTPRRVAQLEPRIRELARRYLEPAVAAGTFDAVGDFAARLPMDVVSELIGVPAADRDQVRAWANLVVHREEGVHDVPAGGRQAAADLLAYYRELIADKRRTPGTDLTSALLQVAVDGHRLGDSDVVPILFLLMLAGNETTNRLLGNALYWGWCHPDQRAEAVAGNVAGWVEETLRFDSPVQVVARTVVQDVVVHGQRVPAGQWMLLLLGAANRDPEVFADPDRYAVGRDTRAARSLLSFGFGPHHCLGAALARLEARVALTLWTEAVGEYDIDPAGVRRVHGMNVRGFTALPVTVKPR